MEDADFPEEAAGFFGAGCAHLTHVHGDWRGRLPPYIHLVVPSSTPGEASAIAPGPQGPRWHRLDLRLGVALESRDLGLSRASVTDLEESGQRLLVSSEGALRLRTSDGRFLWKQRGWGAAWFVPGVDRVIAASSRGEIGEFEASSGEVVARFRGFEVWGSSPAGRWTACSPARGRIGLWDRQQGEVTTVWTLPGGVALHRALPSDDGEVFAVAMLSRSEWHLWRLVPGEKPARWAVPLGPEGHGVALAFAASGASLLAIHAGGSLDEIDLEDGRQRSTRHVGRWEGVRVSRDGSRAVFWHRGVYFSWDASSDRVVRPFSGHESSVDAIATSPDGRQVASRANDRAIRLWNRVDGSCHQILDAAGYGMPPRMLYAADGKAIHATSVVDRKSWNTADGRPTTFPLALPDNTRWWALSPGEQLLWLELGNGMTVIERMLIRRSDQQVLWRGHGNGGLALLDDAAVTVEWERASDRPRLCWLRERDGWEPSFVPLEEPTEWTWRGELNGWQFSDDGSFVAMRRWGKAVIFETSRGKKLGAIDDTYGLSRFGGARWLVAVNQIRDVEIHTLPDLQLRGRLSLGSACDWPDVLHAPDEQCFYVGTHLGVLLRFALAVPAPE